MKYLSLCSGIEAATTAWHDIGWTPLAFSEIEPFPSAVLAHHWPDVPNLGDMTKWREWPEDIFLNADILVGGTPCQAFSVAGLRKSLGDERGNLTLIYAHIIDHIDNVRRKHGRPPAICLWENVPGVLNTKDNAFGCFLGALSGEDDPLVPAGKRWTNAGAVFGPQRTVAWRTLDAQYFGVAQRRRRVFLVGCSGDRTDPTSVLFEREGVRRDSPPRREAGQDTAGSTGDGVAGGREWPAEVTPTLNAHFGEKQGLEDQHALGGAGLFVPQAFRVHGEHSTAMTGKGKANVADPVEVARCLDSCGGYATNQGGNVVAFSCKDHGADAGERSPTLRSRDHDGSHANGGGQVAVAMTFDWQAGGGGTDQSFRGKSRAYITDPPGRKRALNACKTLGLHHGSAVRRLTPVECARLQGFPDHHARISWRGKPADQCPDGPQYKAYGNSMAVPCMRWLGERIALYTNDDL